MRLWFALLLLVGSALAQPNAEQIRAAILDDQPETVRALLEAYPALVNEAPPNGYPPAAEAALYGRVECLRVLLAAGARVAPLRGDREQAMHFAATPEICDILLQHGASTEVLSAAKETPLHLAVRRKNIPVVAWLLQHGARAQAVDMWGRQPLHYARSASMVEVLLKSGIPPEPRESEGLTPALMAALEPDRTEVWQALLKAGADVFTTDLRGRNLLHCAAGSGSVANLQAALALPLDPNSTDILGRTALHYATEGDASSLLTLLLTRGADPTRGDLKGGTALHLAGSVGALGCLGRLVTAGAPLNGQDQAGNTPLHNAVGSGQVQAAEYLLRQGADRGIRNRKGETPLELATRLDQSQLVRMLER